MDNLDTSIKNAKKSLFRFEGLQDYSAEDGDEIVKTFIKTGKLDWLPENNEWWKNIKTMNDKGVKTHRVRLVILPQTDYTKWELALQKECALFSGEDIRIIEENKFNSIIGTQIPDFYLIDDENAFILKYGLKGKYLSNTPVNKIDISHYKDFKIKLLAHSIPVDKYLNRSQTTLQK